MKTLLLLLFVTISICAKAQCATDYNISVDKSFIPVAGTPYADRIDTIVLPSYVRLFTIKNIFGGCEAINQITNLWVPSVTQALLSDSLTTMPRNTFDIYNNYIYIKFATTQQFVYPFNVTYTVTSDNNKLILKTRFINNTLVFIASERITYHIFIAGTYQ
jgi:hypothetical protein